MLDDKLRPYLVPPLNLLAKLAVKAGLTPNQITIGGFIIGVFAFLALALASYDWALGFILINRCADGLDGAVARTIEDQAPGTGITDLGGYLDIVTDFIFYAGVVFFFAVGQPDTALAAAFLIFSFMGTASSFLAYAVLAEKHGMSTKFQQKKKTLYYLGGLTEGTETIVLFVLICLLPGAFIPLAVIFGIMCWITTICRIFEAVNSFGDKPSIE